MKNFAAEKNLPCTIKYLIGHNTLRAAAAGYEKRELSRKELDETAFLLDKSLRDGACGLSLGLLYVPGKFYTSQELNTLFKIVAVHNKIVACHLKSEGKMLIESLEEMINYALESGLKKFHVSHFKTAGKDKNSNRPS